MKGGVGHDPTGPKSILLHASYHNKYKLNRLAMGILTFSGQLTQLFSGKTQSEYFCKHCL